MKIAIDLSPLQNAHRMRGIGFTLINFINNLPAKERKKHSFVFFLLPEVEALFKDPLKPLDLHDFSFEVRSLNKLKRLPYILPGRLNILFGIINRFRSFRSFYFGDSRVPSLKGIDVFLQADQNYPLPRNRRVKKVLILYDLIPYVLEWDYWWNYQTARLRGSGRTKALVKQVKRLLLIHKVRANVKKSDKLLAISELTKEDFIQHLAVPPAKIDVIPLGVSVPKLNTTKIALRQYEKTGWGYTTKPLVLDPKTPYLLFIGGVDSRRKIEDLVSAFNNIRAQGQEVKLVLAGDIMQGPESIPTHAIQTALRESSYLDDIIFMGFVEDAARDWLYRHATAFIFPSRYEGFGLPVLEAMSYGCPVISYKNAATMEVAGNAPIYVDNALELKTAILELLSKKPEELERLKASGIHRAQLYSWEKTALGFFRKMCD